METAESLNDSGIALTEANRPIDAIPLFRKALLMEPENPLLWLNLGIAHQKNGEYENAENSFERCRFLDDSISEAWGALGLLCYEEERFEEAEFYYNGALERNGGSPSLWNNLGVLFFTEGIYDEARSCFERAVSLDPYYWDALFNLRDVCFELKDLRAAEEFDRCLKSLPFPLR